MDHPASIREATFLIERDTLSEYATLSENTAGRMLPEEECDIRTPFQRDRDRIIHSKSFRRLKHKTQVFLSPEGDHYRTRLTHTLEVSQIARTIARALRLNEDLTEAISLGHDLGHTPFGHTGEEILSGIVPGGFLHNEQSLRVVDVLEKERRGLNLTAEVRDGIIRHSGDDEAATREGRIIKLADRIAYINHDIDDAVRAGVLSEEDIPADIKEALGHTHNKRINTLVRAAIRGSAQGEIAVSSDAAPYMNRLRDFMFERVYYNPDAKREDEKAKTVLSMLYEYFMGDISRLPDEFSRHAESEGAARVVTDYIAGMTDRFAVSLFEELYVPKMWK